MGGIIIILLAVFVASGWENKIRTNYSNFDDFTFLSLEKGKSIEQKFRCTQNYLESISLFFVNISSEMEKAEVEIMDLEGEVVFKTVIEAAQLLPGEFNEFSVKKYVKKDVEYILRISYHGKEAGDYLGVLATMPNKNRANNGECIYGGNPIDVNVVALFETKDISMTGLTVVSAALLLLFVFVFPERRKEYE